MKIYIDGTLFEKDQARVSVFDHGLLYGDGVFEGVRAYDGRVFRLREHVARLYDSAKGILLEIPCAREEFEKIILDTIRANGLRDAYVRAVVTRGTGDLGLDMRKCRRATIIVIADRIALFPAEVYEKGLVLATSSLRRLPADALSPAVKSLNYLNNILARAEAARAGAHEALLLNAQGHVAECSGDNVFVLRRARVSTPPAWSGILRGVTRDAVMGLIGERLGAEVAEEPLTLQDLYAADEVFVTGTGAEVIGAVRVDGRVIGDGRPGPFTRRVMEAFRAYAAATGTPVYAETEAGRP